MKLDSNTKEIQHHNTLAQISKALLTVVLMSSLVLQLSCSKSTENKTSSDSATSTTKTTKTQEQLDSISKNKEIREARRAKTLSAVNLGYVDQPHIVSNGKDFGVKILAIRLTAKNYMLDFRFHINDLEKAKEIMQRKVKAKLIVEKNKGELRVPVSYKLGALRQSGNNLVANKNYFMFFANPGGHVKPGDLVTFELGGFKAEHIIVN